DETSKRDKLIKELELAIANEIEQKGDIDKSKRFTATSMLECLKSKVEEEELNENEILKLQTIQGWIARYSAQYRQKMAEKSIEASYNRINFLLLILRDLSKLHMVQDLTRSQIQDPNNSRSQISRTTSIQNN
ncbi:16175_t:CDS:2, partial [Gigaspora margarita]